MGCLTDSSPFRFLLSHWILLVSRRSPVWIFVVGGTQWQETLHSKHYYHSGHRHNYDL
jgi:hypothetical protein